MLEHIQKIARETLYALKSIADTAEEKLGQSQGGKPVATFANPKPPTRALKNLREISDREKANLRCLKGKPAVARVVVTNYESGEREIYYICRNTAIQVPKIKLAGYRTPKGRFASLDVGDEEEVFLEGEKVTFRVDEVADFTPEQQDGELDATQAFLKMEDGEKTEPSFRALLPTELAPEEDFSELETQLREDHGEQTKLRRNLISKMALRDQPILDKFQDEIFRLPLSSRLFITGAPGTGKTTTLIRRLGQKLDSDADSDALTQEEKTKINLYGSGEPRQSWLMFTPTELLTRYIKEAFNREGIAAPDDNITTWNDYRVYLARSVFDFLRTPAKQSGFIMNEEVRTLNPETETLTSEWFSDFNEWQGMLFWKNTRKEAADLVKNAPQTPIASEEVIEIAGRIQSTLGQKSDSFDINNIVRLLLLSGDVANVQNTLRQDSELQIERTLNLQVNRDKEFLRSLGDFVDSIEESELESDKAVLPEYEEEEEENTSPPKFGRDEAAKFYRSAIRAYARAKTQSGVLKNSSRNGKIIEWLGERTPEAERIDHIGRSLIVQSVLRRFVNPLGRFINQIPRRYLAYRRERQKQGKWYRDGSFSTTDIHLLEGDIILLAMLVSLNKIFDATPSSQREHPLFAKLASLYRNQIVVDEATDFSPVQIGCMYALCNYKIQSFFACGDLNQRLTREGLRSDRQMEWAIPDITIKPVSLVYRQSDELFRLANALVGKNTVDAESQLPSKFDNRGFAPVLKETISDNTDIAKWLIDRIVEVEEATKSAQHRALPSIAILVHDEDKVTALEKPLKLESQPLNLKVIACRDGNVLGKDSAVRIFNVQHIKGLEFEAVFFIGIDQIEKDLYEKYLYVGATRAATYLGMTCQNELPKRLERLREMFRERFIS